MADEEEYNSIVCKNYNEIQKNLKNLYIKLYNKLVDNGVLIATCNKKSFTDLINEMNSIQTVEYYYSFNTKPTDDIVLQDIDTEHPIPPTEYNTLLSQKINFYMRLMGYYLILKGVPLPYINSNTTLNERIDLIDKMDKRYHTTFVIDIPKNYLLYGKKNIVRYSFPDVNGEIDGTITVYDDEGIQITRINIGDELSFYPTSAGNHTYIFEYSGDTHYTQTYTEKNINILPYNKIYIDDVALLENGNLRFMYTDGDIEENTNIITNMIINANGDLQYTVQAPISTEFDEIEEGITYIEISSDNIKYKIL